MTDDLRRLHTARAQADRRAARAEQVRDAAEAQAAQVRDARQGITESLSATQAHQAEVQQRTQAGERSAAEHEQGGAKVHGAAAQLAGVTTLEALLAGWSGFTGLVLRFSAVLPDRAVSAFDKMNADSTDFMARLAHVKAGVAEQEAQQPERGARIAQTGGRLTAVGQRAQETREQFSRAQQRSADLATTNQDHVAYAESERASAAQCVSQADEQIVSVDTGRQTLAQQMTAWATEHRAAREQAVEEAIRRMEQRGLRVTRRPPR
jgi:hypothetical protein